MSMLKWKKFESKNILLFYVCKSMQCSQRNWFVSAPAIATYRRLGLTGIINRQITLIISYCYHNVDDKSKQ